jgi:hypothetical protein
MLIETLQKKTISHALTTRSDRKNYKPRQGDAIPADRSRQSLVAVAEILDSGTDSKVFIGSRLRPRDRGLQSSPS